jgi:general stress protein YciG
MAGRKLTRSEAGRKGGQTTLQRYGTEFYQRIGQIGGKKGGKTTKERYGTKFYQEIGRKGGKK